MKQIVFIQQINYTAFAIILKLFSSDFDLTEDRKQWQRIVCTDAGSPKVLHTQEKPAFNELDQSVWYGFAGTITSTNKCIGIL